MFDQSSNQNLKAFVHEAFAEESRRQHEKAEQRMNLPIDLAAGGLFNMEQLTYYYVSPEDESRYKRRIERSLDSIANLNYEEAATLNNVFLNIERLLLKMIKRYYDSEQLKLFTNETSLVSEDIKQSTWMFQDRLFELFDNKEKKWDMFDYMIFLPGWRQHNAALKLKSPDGRVSIEQGIISYLISDLIQTYLNSLTDSLRTDMVLLSQFIYQLFLLAENATEVLTLLYTKYNPTD